MSDLGVGIDHVSLKMGLGTDYFDDGNLSQSAFGSALKKFAVFAAAFGTVVGGKKLLDRYPRTKRLALKVGSDLRASLTKKRQETQMLATDSKKTVVDGGRAVNPFEEETLDAIAQWELKDGRESSRIVQKRDTIFLEQLAPPEGTTLPTMMQILAQLPTMAQEGYQDVGTRGGFFNKIGAVIAARTHASSQLHRLAEPRHGMIAKRRTAKTTMKVQQQVRKNFARAVAMM